MDLRQPLEYALLTDDLLMSLLLAWLAAFAIVLAYWWEESRHR
jgi:hypothetical protein